MSKKVLITGGSDGLGLATAKLLVTKGYQVNILGRDQTKLHQAAQEINNPELKTWQCDLTDYEQVAATAAKIGALDILINNAGIWLEGSLGSNEPKVIAQVVDTNFKGVIYATKAFLPEMLKQNSGIILNISSTSGLRGRSNQAVYAASKWAVTGFTECLKEDLAATKIKVIGFYPGGMATKLFAKAGTPKPNENWMSPEKVAGVIAFALETDASMNLDHIVLNKFAK
jgi:NADP-dependent 3-hydroxy acid dehydrogenase YdfG